MELIEPYIYKNEKPRINTPMLNKKSKNITNCAKNLNGDNKLAWLLKALSCIDLTTLAGNDTASNIEGLCAKAVKPLTLNFDWPYPLHTAAVCVYPARVHNVVRNLRGFGADTIVKIASVAGGFPSGQYPLETRVNEIRKAISFGANEIDVVINRELAITHKWLDLYKELVEMRKACEGVCMKTILSVGELNNWQDVYITSMIAMAAGSDFIKTSTGKEEVNATLPAGLVMCRAIKHFYNKTGVKIGFKPAGGIRTTMDALSWLILVKQELGDKWLNESLFRIGASSVLDDIVKNIQFLLQ